MAKLQAILSVRFPSPVALKYFEEMSKNAKKAFDGRMVVVRGNRPLIATYILEAGKVIQISEFIANLDHALNDWLQKSDGGFAAFSWCPLKTKKDWTL